MEGHGLILTLLAVFFGTMVSEDLATISAGMLAASGKLDFPLAVLASYSGIFVGDLIIFWMGRHFGRPLLRHRWARWFISGRAVDRAQDLFHRHGVWLIVVTRFIPGTRTATYFSAGALHAPFLRFTLAFALAAAVWTPLLVGLSCLIGARLLEAYELYEAFAVPVLVAAGLCLYLLFHYGLPLFTWKGRRRLLGRWQRAVQWEFWPWWQVNWLVVLHALWTGTVRYRRPLLVTAANPCMPHSGFIGESKSAILEGLAGAGDAVPRWRRIPAGPADARVRAYEQALAELGLELPVVLKPDEGQRGAGVKIVRRPGEAQDWLVRQRGAAILMEFVAGREYGIFYVRPPSAERGRIISITIKEQVTVTGNGRDTLETLIHAHPRAIALLSTFIDRFAGELDRVPAAGETVPLGELGTHARGAIFRDGGHLLTPELEARMDAIARSFAGFHFGRFDIKAPDEAALRAGRGLRIIELNGLTSESTHIYDPRHGLLHAWRTLCAQWSLAYAIAHENAARGHAPSTLPVFLRDLFAALQRQREQG